MIREGFKDLPMPLLGFGCGFLHFGWAGSGREGDPLGFQESLDRWNVFAGDAFTMLAP
jgi:hypothetical protein